MKTEPIYRRILALLLTGIILLQAQTPAASVSDQLERAEQLLQSQTVAVSKTLHRKILEIHLAVLCEGDAEQQLVRLFVDSDGTNLHSATEGFDIKLLRFYEGDLIRAPGHNPAWNYFNSHYEVMFEEKLCTVLRNRYPLEKPGTPFDISVTGGITYTPYSDRLKQQYPELVADGKMYLLAQIERAYDDLNRGGIVPRSGRPHFRNVIDPHTLAGIFAAEHMSDKTFAVNPDGALERFFVLLGANREQTFGYTVSRARASGLAQFIFSTYFNIVVKQYPEANLIGAQTYSEYQNAKAESRDQKKSTAVRRAARRRAEELQQQLTLDFSLAMSDHKNAMMAAILLMDFNLAEIQKLKGFSDDQKDALLAIRYNSRPYWATRYLQAHPQRKLNSLKHETRVYLQKIEFAKRHFRDHDFRK